MNFSEYLEDKKISPGLRAVLVDIALSVREISDALAAGNEGYAGGENVFGDRQVKMDLIANGILLNRLKKNVRVLFVASEEMENPYEREGGGGGEGGGGAGVCGEGAGGGGAGVCGEGAGGGGAGVLAADADGGFSVCFDPLDGSALVDANLAVGTIVGVYQGKGVNGRSGAEQVAVVLALYGPRLTLMLAVDEWKLGGGGTDAGGAGDTSGGTDAGGAADAGGDLPACVDEFIYDESRGNFVLNKAGLKLEESGKIFSPGNISVCAENQTYSDLLMGWMKNGYKLRYSGCLAADINHILKKKGGIFLYPAGASAPEGKLRLLYECAPLAMLVERAGGMAVAGGEAVSGAAGEAWGEAVSGAAVGLAGEKEIGRAGDSFVRRILDIKIESTEQTVPVIMGSKNEVILAMKNLTGLNNNGR